MFEIVETPEGRRGGVILWLMAMRIQFLQASLIPVAVGSALAFRDGKFVFSIFWIIGLAIAAINIGTNLMNDYFDHRSGADERNRYPTRFSGGSRVIQEGLISPGEILAAAVISYGIAMIAGLYLVALSDWTVFFLGATGIVLSFFYTAPPFKLGYRGWGELLVGLLLGPLAVMGAYYVYTGNVSAQAFWVSLPIGFLVAGILFINQFPDMEPDMACGKLHWVARLGKKKAVPGYFAIIGAAYSIVVISVMLGVLTAWYLLALLSLPLAVAAARILLRSYHNARGLVPAMALTVGSHLSTGLLLVIAAVLERLTS